jgi:hypothetical protein
MNETATTQLATLPALGAAFEGGIFAGLTTDKEGRHFAVTLLPDKPAKRLPWKKAVDWAASVDGTLPTRPVAALLFANAKDQFDRDWHWTSEAFDGSYAWDQYLLYGDQTTTLKSYEGQARAVRLIHLSA